MLFAGIVAHHSLLEIPECFAKETHHGLHTTQDLSGGLPLTIFIVAPNIADDVGLFFKERTDFFQYLSETLSRS